MATIEAGTVFMLRDGHTTAGAITLTPDAEEGMWTDEELVEPSIFANKLTVAREYGGQNLGERLVDWAGDRAGARWLRLHAWTTNEGLQWYYLAQGFTHVRTVNEGTAINGGPRVSGWLAQRKARLTTDYGFTDRTPPERLRFAA
ncbi:GNAT family N-acetyltransferase [Streptomyces sp. SID12501]|uniref:GNAT family N-acetyltransferase n=1 Tax=Streptomyces sp. SID12501 TaxID=2706042 RepID=A0A6B3BQI6_9ACTN|nr:GNAT family N-acetyltransferase [Streptomyces sp. SID12501]